MRLSRVLVAAALLPLTFVGFGRPSSAAEMSPAGAYFDVQIRAQGFHIKSGGCQYVPFQVRHSAGYLDRFTAEVEVWKGPQYLDRTFDYVYDSAGPLQASFFVCVSERDDLGTYRLGPGQGEYNDYDEEVDGTWSDSSTARVKVLQHSRFQGLQASKRAGVRIFSGRLSYFDAGVERFTSAPRGTLVRLQRQRPGGVWADVANARVGRTGSVKVRIRSAKAATYRFAFGGTAITWNARSAEIRG